MKILITGVAGFIGMSVAKRLLEDRLEVIGVDNLNAYYSQKLKLERLSQIINHSNFSFHEINISNVDQVKSIFDRYKPNVVLNLAAQAGVRYSISNPEDYIESNLTGFANVIKNCRDYEVEHFVYASSSSVYGMNEKIPFHENDRVDHPVSLYAATKRANELIAHSYSHVYDLPTTALRYFTVYGPWGRPDMAPWLFTSAILEGRPLNIYNHGKMKRDFTYIDDIVEGTVRVLYKSPSLNQESREKRIGARNAPYRILNIGNGTPVDLMVFIQKLGEKLGTIPILNFEPMQQGDVELTYADVSTLSELVGYKSITPIEIGLNKWLDWYLSYHEIR